MLRKLPSQAATGPPLVHFDHAHKFEAGEAYKRFACRLFVQLRAWLTLSIQAEPTSAPKNITPS